MGFTANDDVTTVSAKSVLFSWIIGKTRLIFNQVFFSYLCLAGRTDIHPNCLTTTGYVRCICIPHTDGNISQA